MKQQGTIALFQYWDRLRAGRPAPKRTEIEPADIKSLLADTFILEKDVRNTAVFRLAGTRLCAIYGRELKGFAFASMWTEKDQGLVGRLAHGVFLSKSVVVVSFEGVSRGGRLNAFELILLPLDGGAEHQRCLGAVTSSEKPFWLGVDPVVESHMTSVRVVDPDREPLFLKNRPEVLVPSLAPAPADLDPAGRTTDRARRIRHLLVIDGGREE